MPRCHRSALLVAVACFGWYAAGTEVCAGRCEQVQGCLLRAIGLLSGWKAATSTMLENVKALKPCVEDAVSPLRLEGPEVGEGAYPCERAGRALGGLGGCGNEWGGHKACLRWSWVGLLRRDRCLRSTSPA